MYQCRLAITRFLSDVLV